MFDRLILLNVYFDSKRLLTAIVNIHPTAEKRSHIDPSLLCEAFELREIDQVFWLPLKVNPTDASSKESSSRTLTDQVKMKKLQLKAKKWVSVRKRNSFMKNGHNSQKITKIEPSAGLTTNR